MLEWSEAVWRFAVRKKSGAMTGGLGPSGLNDFCLYLPPESVNVQFHQYLLAQVCKNPHNYITVMVDWALMVYLAT